MLEKNIFNLTLVYLYTYSATILHSVCLLHFSLLPEVEKKNLVNLTIDSKNAFLSKIW